MTFRLGLTGSIGMGKSTTAEMFRAEGIPVWDADAAVHRLYQAGGAAVEPIQQLAPSAVTEGAVDRDELKALLSDNPELIKELEAIVHPLVAQDRTRFADASDAEITVFDVPLLFENGSEAWFDAVCVVTTSAQEQSRRVLARPGMTQEHFDFVLSRQMPDKEKRQKADFIIRSDTRETAQQDVVSTLDTIRQGLTDA